MTSERVFTKEGLTSELREISEAGWFLNTKSHNSGSVGNLLEDLLGIEENNLPLPNASEWELKAKREQSASLVTLKHLSPSPRALKLVPQILLPKYGWPHAQAGAKYPTTELSFRQTLTSRQFTDRGFTLLVDQDAGHLRVSFEASRVDLAKHAEWLSSVETRVGNLGDLNPAPYWGIDDLKRKMGEKLNNAFFVTAKVRKDKDTDREFFWYVKAEMVSGFDFDQFVAALDSGKAKVDFDARTGHDHGTKFRIREDALVSLYANRQTLFDYSDLDCPSEITTMSPAPREGAIVIQSAAIHSLPTLPLL